MLSRRMLVLGSCSAEDFEIIENSVREKLTNQEQTAIMFMPLEKFCPDQHGSTNQYRIVEEFGKNISQELQVSFQSIDITFVCNNLTIRIGDDAQNSIQRFVKALRIFDTVKDMLGIQSVRANLVWLADSTSQTAGERRAALDEICENGVLKFSTVFLLTDRRSNSTPCYPFERIQAAATLINTLMIQHTEIGFFTVGVGKINTSIHEMQKFARHQVAEAISERRIIISKAPSMKDLCNEAFGVAPEERLIAYLSNAVWGKIVKNFCYIHGSDTTSSTVCLPDEIDFSDEISKWEAALKRMIRQMLFPEVAEAFFSEQGGFPSYAVELKNKISGLDQDDKVRIPLFGLKKKVAIAYNEFLEKKKSAFSECIRAFIEQMDKTRPRLRQFAVECKMKRNKLLSKYNQEDSFIRRCNDMAPGIAQNVIGCIHNLTMEWPVFQKNYLGKVKGEASITAQTIEKLMAWALEETDANNAMNNLIISQAHKTIPDIHKDIVKPIESQTDIVLACSRYNEISTVGDKYIFFAKEFPVTNMQTQLDQRLNLIQVNNPAYLNVEGLSLVRLSDKFDSEQVRSTAESLTVFADIHLPDFTERRSYWEQQPQPEVEQEEGGEPEKPVIEQPVSKQEKDENSWNVTVTVDKSGKFMLSRTWRDKSLTRVNVFVLDEDKHENGPKVIARDAVGAYEDISNLVPHGKCFLELRRTDNASVLSRCEFQGRRTIIELVRGKKKTIALSRDCTLIMCMVSSQRDQPVPPEALRNIVVLQEKDFIQLSSPKEKRNRQCWQIITKNSFFDIGILEAYATRYDVKLLDSKCSSHDLLQQKER